MRLAVILEVPASNGGVFQHILSTVEDLRRLARHEIIVLTPRPENVEALGRRGIICHFYKFGRLRRFLSRLGFRSELVRKFVNSLPRALRRAGSSFDFELDAYDIDLTLFFHSSLPLYVRRHAFVASVYDLCHRDWPEFPEVNEQFEGRERAFVGTLARAVAVIVSASSLARDVCRFYGVKEERVSVLPFAPAIHSRQSASPEKVAQVRAKFQLANEYVFYPAQFWPHKNHIYLLDGLRSLKAQVGIRIDSVFCGSDVGNGANVRRHAEALGLLDSTHFLGFVDDDDMAALYTGARALVMPSYFGPTNLPPLEALAVGCPVVYSDIPEFRQELGAAALYCNLRDPASLAAQLKIILTEPETVATLLRAGDEVVGRAASANFVAGINEIAESFDYIRHRWQCDVTNLS